MSSRNELIHEMKMTQIDQQERHEQLLTTLITKLSTGNLASKPVEIQPSSEDLPQS